jgi:hypothetical protein
LFSFYGATIGRRKLVVRADCYSRTRFGVFSREQHQQDQRKKHPGFHLTSERIEIDVTRHKRVSQGFSGSPFGYVILIGQFMTRMSITLGTTGGIFLPEHKSRSGIKRSQAG